MSEKMKIFLHGGMHKTGTTALQYLLASEREELLKHGLFYPDAGCQHHNFILHLTSRDWSPEPLLHQIQLARQSKTSTVIFSAEVLSILSNDQIKKLCNCLSGHEVIFLFAFRHWCNFLPSRWAQNCQVRDSQTFNEYINNLCNFPNGHLDARYDLIINRFQKNSNAKIQAVSYSNSRKLNRSVLSDILLSMEFSPDLIEKLLIKEREVNVRPTWVEIEQHRLLNEALSEYLSLNKNELFQSIGEFGAGDVDYYLKLEKFDSNLLKSLEKAIIANEKKVHLSSNDSWIKDLNSRFQNTCAQYFLNLHHNQIFHGDYDSVVNCSDLHLSDILNVNLNKAMRGFKINDFS